MLGHKRILLGSVVKLSYHDRLLRPRGGRGHVGHGLVLLSPRWTEAPGPPVWWSRRVLVAPWHGGRDHVGRKPDPAWRPLVAVHLDPVAGIQCTESLTALATAPSWLAQYFRTAKFLDARCANLIETPKKETVSMADPSLINQWLQHHGYSLHPGDARAITQCYTDTMLPQNPPFDEAALHQCAVAQGLTRHPSRIPEPRRCPSLPSMLRDTIFTRVRQFWNTVSDADYDAYLALPDLIDQMLDGPWYRTRIENVGYDRSSYPQAVSYRPWLLTEFASVYDAYDHVLTGEPIPTFVSGSGMAA